MDDSPIDSALAWLAGLAVTVITCSCMVQLRWVWPPPDGAGPYAGPDRLHVMHVELVVAALLGLLCLARAWLRRSGAAMFAAFLVAVAAGLLVLPLYLPPEHAELRADGFADDWYSVAVDNTFVLYNTGPAELTVCLGTLGDCDSAAPGPKQLRAPGLAVPAGHRVSFPTPKKARDLRMTIATPGPQLSAHRDAILHLYVPDSSGGP